MGRGKRKLTPGLALTPPRTSPRQARPREAFEPVYSELSYEDLRLQARSGRDLVRGCIEAWLATNHLPLNVPIAAQAFAATRRGGAYAVALERLCQAMLEDPELWNRFKDRSYAHFWEEPEVEIQSLVGPRRTRPLYSGQSLQKLSRYLDNADQVLPAARRTLAEAAAQGEGIADPLREVGVQLKAEDFRQFLAAHQSSPYWAGARVIVQPSDNRLVRENSHDGFAHAALQAETEEGRVIVNVWHYLGAVSDKNDTVLKRSWLQKAQLPVFTASEKLVRSYHAGEAPIVDEELLPPAPRASLHDLLGADSCSHPRARWDDEPVVAYRVEGLKSAYARLVCPDCLHPELAIEPRHRFGAGSPQAIAPEEESSYLKSQRVAAILRGEKVPDSIDELRQRDGMAQEAPSAYPLVDGAVTRPPAAWSPPRDLVSFLEN